MKKAISRTKTEIFNHKKNVYISVFDATEKQEFTLTFRNEDEAYEFSTRLRKALNEVNERGHYMNSEKISMFMNPSEGWGRITFDEDAYEFKYADFTNPKKCHRTLSKLILGDLAD
jgi:hypothetical protein